uniref:Midkine n=1 Tax=Oncorhynchus kisutch TaxID=8019 RepID=A0A8C7DLU6_ONCKI
MVTKKVRCDQTTLMCTVCQIKKMYPFEGAHVMLCYCKCQAKSIKLFICFIFGATGQKAKEGGKAECAEKRFGKCVPNAGDCGDGFREATCSEHTTKHKCNIPCNWKKAFGADCKYRFTNWGECDTTTGTKSRSGTLKKDMFKLDCEATITVTKPCSSKPKGKGGKGKRTE